MKFYSVTVVAGDNEVFSRMYVGCFSDVTISNVTAWDVKLINEWNGMTLAHCVPACKQLGKRYAIVQVLTVNLSAITKQSTVNFKNNNAK